MPKAALAETIAEQEILDGLLDNALREDIGEGDCTTSLLVPASMQVKAVIVAKQAGVLAGGPLVARLFHRLDKTLDVRPLREDGSWAELGDEVMALEGRAQAILTGERVCLNFFGRLSGIATLTGRFVDAVKRWDVKILDTRKTTPGLRLLERYAVRVGGGENHRFGLFDQLLVKDNHHQALAALPAGTLERKIAEFRKTHPGMLVEIEVDELEQLDGVMRAKPDIVLLDNMDTDTVNEAVRMVGKRALTEVSGGVTLENAEEYAKTGVDRISIGALTHSAPQIDFSLEMLSQREPQ